jgi:His/Glu/Gln/Arg/opine family amino acid ABC transporter permease subunit
MIPFDFSILQSEQGAILQGLSTTAFISFAATSLALLIGLIVALLLKMRVPVLQSLVQGYVLFFRNTPLLVQLYFIYRGLPHIGLTISPLLCGVIALALQSGAYISEIYRAGLESVPREQLESAMSLGFTKLKAYFIVILPQAVQIILPPLGNQIVGLVKNSSLVAFISVPDLFFIIYKGGAEQFRYLEFFTVGIIGYVALTLLVTVIFRLLEAQFAILFHTPEKTVSYAQ